MRVHIVPHPRQYLGFSVFLIVAILAGEKFSLSVVLFCLFLMTHASFYDLISHAYIFFLCSACSRIWPFKKKNVFLLLNHRSFVYILGTSIFCTHCEFSPNIYHLYLLFNGDF